MGYGAQQAGTPPFFVVTHTAPQQVRLERELGMRFAFVDELTTAVDQARTAATDGHVVIMGGGDVIGQAIEQGLVDELHLHLAPLLLGGGTPLFRPGTPPPRRSSSSPTRRQSRSAWNASWACGSPSWTT